MKRNKELLLEIVNFFIENPFDEEHLGVNQKSWRLFFQANFPDPRTGEWFDIEDPDFFLRIYEILLPEPEELTPNVPPHLAQLVEDWEKAKVSREKEKEIKKSLEEEIKATLREVHAQWEIGRHEQLIEKDIKPKIIRLQKEVGNEVETFDVKFKQLQETSDKVSQVLSEIPEEELVKAIEEKKLKEEVLKPAIIKGLEIKGGLLTDKDYEETFGMPKEVAEALGAGKALEEIGEKVATELADDIEVQKNFDQQLRLFQLKEFTQRRIAYLEKRAEDPNYEPEESFQDVDTWAKNDVREFTSQILHFPAIKNQLITKLGLTEADIDRLILDITHFINSGTFLSQRPSLWTQPEAQFTASIIKVFSQAFEYNLRRPAIRNVVSAIINSIPFLRTQKAKAAKEIVEEARSKFETPPPEIISTIKAATLANYGLTGESTEAGTPWGRLPSFVLREIVILPEMLEKLKKYPEISQIFLGLKEPYLQMPPEQFVEAFQKYWAVLYQPAKPLSLSQRAAIGKYVEFLQAFQRINPAAFRLFYWQQKHLIGLSWGKAVASYFIKYPDYVLHFPFIFGKYYILNKWSLKWQYTLKPKVFGFIINRIPGIGQALGFLYKRDEWGLYQGPIARLKSKARRFILQKGIGGTGRLLLSLGKKIGKTRLGQILMGWGKKLIGMATTGGIGALLFAFYPFFKKTIKRLLALFGAISLGIFLWAKTYGIGALIGWGAGTVGGIYPAVLVGKAVFSATLPFIGPFAIIPAVVAGGVTWLACQVMGAGLGILATKIWLGIKESIGSSFGSLVAAPVAKAGVVGAGAVTLIPLNTASLIAGATPLVIGALAVGTIIITSSAFVIPVEQAEYGSRYIEIQKGFDIDGNPQSTTTFKNEEIINHKLKYGIKVIISGQTLTNVVINDEMEIIKENEIIEYRNETWNQENTPELAEMNPGDSWETTYEFTPDDRFRDSLLSNTVTVTSNEGETQMLTLSLSIGKAPFSGAVALTRKVVDTLRGCQCSRECPAGCPLKCPPGSPTKCENCLPRGGNDGIIVNSSTWSIARQCLEDSDLDANAKNFIIDMFSGCVQSFNNLQCVCFLQGTTLGDLEGKIAARYYCSESTPGYTLKTDWENIQIGDMIVSDASTTGHIAMAVKPPVKNTSGKLLYVEVAEAIGTNGVVEYRPVDAVVLESRYCGYLRKGG